MANREEAIVRAVAGQLPTTDRAAIPKLLDEGFGSVVLKVGGSVIRAARNDDSRLGHELEARLLPRVAGSLPVEVPTLTIVPSSSSLPYGATVHGYLPGRPMTSQDGYRWPTLADEVAAFLIALHGTPAADLFDVRRWDPGEMLSGLEDALSEARLACRHEIGFDARWEECRRWVSVDHPEVLCHGDRGSGTCSSMVLRGT